MEYTQAGSQRRPRWAVRAAIAGTSVLGLVGIAAPAWADVSVTPTEAAQRDAANLTFRITNESQTASITTIDVQLPADTPIAEVYPLSVADWAPAMTNVKIDKPVESLHGYQITDVTTAVKWIAMPGKELPPGGTTELPLSIGPLPAVAKLSFGVVLTNSDGTQVRWTGQPGAAAAPGEHPAPVLALTAAPAGQGGHAAEHGGAIPDGTADTAGDAADAADAGGSAPTGGTSYLGWALAALVLIAAICVFGVVLDHRRTAASGAQEPDAPTPDSEAAPTEGKSMATAHGKSAP
ncbi:YcnI family protein [Dactylosporangium sp. CA-092794]|uniref:YcnI family protein n=1 Tax=Dactylosporangium sp. CA-092794 TaxID=3239929 RepID=UPI003D8E5EC9